MNFNEELSQRVNAIEEILDRFLPPEDLVQRTISEAMNYSVLAGGKRLRPMLMSETFQLFGGTHKEILEPFMAAIEMIHTYSLVHDDLPAMDNDEYRRGRKTTHVVYGEAMAILAGDGLLNYAFESALKSFDSVKEEPALRVDLYERIFKSMQVLAGKAGIFGMIGGQVIDMEEYKGEINRERLDLMYGLKTGALIEASMMIGAILGGANPQEVQKVENIAGLIGLAFQIKDDILDVTGTTEVLGKPIGSDEKNEKTTYVTIMKLERANEEVLRISNEAINSYDELGLRNEFLRELVMMLVSREK